MVQKEKRNVMRGKGEIGKQHKRESEKDSTEKAKSKSTNKKSVYNKKEMKEMNNNKTE